MEKNTQTTKKRGGKRPGAGRPPGKVKRAHWTIWASDYEYAKVKEYLFKIHQDDPEE